MSKTRGFVFYDGPSAIDGAPIIGIAVLRSKNVKTGDMVQTFILRADQSPLAAIDTGADASICGDCVHRGAPGRVRTCYVDVAKSVQSVYAAWARGAYPLVSPSAGARMLTGRAVRLGAYGDPAGRAGAVLTWSEPLCTQSKPATRTEPAPGTPSRRGPPCPCSWPH